MKYMIFDTETGGFDAEKDALMSIAGIVLDEELSENTLTRFYTLVQNNDNKEISEKALEVNKIPVAHLELGMSLEFLRDFWNEMVETVDVVIGHNVAFDIRFAEANGLVVPEETLDTMHLAWDTWSVAQSASLPECYMRIGREVKNAHNSLYDCFMTMKLLQWYVDAGFITLPLQTYPVVHNYYEKGAKGYVAMKEKGLL